MSMDAEEMVALLREALEELTKDYWEYFRDAYDGENFRAYDKAIAALKVSKHYKVPVIPHADRPLIKAIEKLKEDLEGMVQHRKLYVIEESSHGANTSGFLNLCKGWYLESELSETERVTRLYKEPDHRCQHTLTVFKWEGKLIKEVIPEAEDIIEKHDNH